MSCDGTGRALQLSANYGIARYATPAPTCMHDEWMTDWWVSSRTGSVLTFLRLCASESVKGSRVTVDTPRSLEHLGLIASPILPAILDAIPCMSSRRSLKDVFEQNAANETSLRPKSWKRTTLEARVLIRVF